MDGEAILLMVQPSSCWCGHLIDVVVLYCLYDHLIDGAAILLMVPVFCRLSGQLVDGAAILLMSGQQGAIVVILLICGHLFDMTPFC